MLARCVGMCDVCFAAAMQPVGILFNPESDHIVFSGFIVGVVNCTFDRMFVDMAVLRWCRNVLV